MGKVDPGLLFEALKALDLSPQRTATGITWYGGEYNTTTHTANIRASRMAGQTVDETTGQIKQAYGHQVAQQYAAKWGWKLTKTAENKYVAIKRSY